jgi:hypothetical protein
MKEAKNRGKRVKLVRDRLFINNEEYVPEEEQITLPAATSMNFKQARSTTPVPPPIVTAGQRNDLVLDLPPSDLHTRIT